MPNSDAKPPALPVELQPEKVLDEDPRVLLVDGEAERLEAPGHGVSFRAGVLAGGA